jgi:hypothetical protein
MPLCSLVLVAICLKHGEISGRVLLARDDRIVKVKARSKSTLKLGEKEQSCEPPCVGALPRSLFLRLV